MPSTGEIAEQVAGHPWSAFDVIWFDPYCLVDFTRETRGTNLKEEEEPGA
jgi:hypothetical protein